MLYVDSTSCAEHDVVVSDLRFPHTTGEQKKIRTFLVNSIMSRPYAVTEDEMARHGSLPTVAPVKP